MQILDCHNSERGIIKIDLHLTKLCFFDSQCILSYRINESRIYFNSQLPSELLIIGKKVNLLRNLWLIRVYSYALETKRTNKVRLQNLDL